MRGLLALSGRSVLRPLILCLREACVVKAAGTEGLQGLSGGGKGGPSSSELLLECPESEVSSASLVVAGNEVSTGIEGLHRSSLSLTRVSVKVCSPLEAASPTLKWVHTGVDTSSCFTGVGEIGCRLSTGVNELLEVVSTLMGGKLWLCSMCRG